MKRLLLGLMAALTIACAPAWADSGSGGRPTTQAVTCAACATSANQTSANTKLDTLHTDLGQVHTDLTAATPAGTNLIGKVGIDQTTDYTTNRVTVPFSHLKECSGTLTPSASAYVAGNALGSGALFCDLTGYVPANGWVRINRGGFNITFASITGSTALVFAFFNAAPAATITDAASPTWTATDSARLRPALAVTAALSGVMQTSQLNPAADTIDIQLDGNCKFYFVPVMNGAVTYTTPGVGTWWFHVAY